MEQNKFIKNLEDARQIIRDARASLTQDRDGELDFLLWRVESAIQRRINNNDWWK